MKNFNAVYSLLLIGVFISSGVMAQNRDAIKLVHFNELTFTSAFEESIFKDIQQSGFTGYFNFFLCIDSGISLSKAAEYHAKFNRMMANYEIPYYQKLADRKKVQKIYSSVHKDMLDKYSTQAPFSKIFSTGEYYCVTSSMLYSLVFDELKIPYEIRLMPNHVYLVAYPSSLHIIVETTDPLRGTIIYDQVFKAKFAEYLRDAKLISRDEFNTKTIDQLFEEYFNKTKSIDKIQLGSLQYQNQAIVGLQNLDYRMSSQMLEKAWVLNPDTLNTYLLFVSWLLDYTNMNKGEVAAAIQLGKLSRFTGKGLTVDDLVGEFAMITQKQLLYEGDEELFDSSFHCLKSYATDSILKNELAFIYNYERGRTLCNKREYKEAIPFTCEAFQLKPKNVDAKNNLLLAINNTLEMEAPRDRLALVNQVAGEVPILLEDKLFAQLRLSMYLMMVDMSFMERNASEGEFYRREFEKMYPEKIGAYQYLDGDIERAYGTAASYYFRLGKTKRSREIIDKALHYVPNSYELILRLNALR